MEIAKSYCKGYTPAYYFDFMEDTAIVGGADVGTFSSDVTLTSGTKNLSAAGHTIASVANVLVVPVTIAFPFTVVVELIRTVDSGAAERAFQFHDNVSAAEAAFLTINVTDVYRAQKNVAGVLTGDCATGVTPVLGGPANKFAIRYEANNMRCYSHGATAGSDTSVAMGVNPTHLRIGSNVGGTALFTGIIQRFAVISGGVINNDLLALSK
jgi:hypothetical protein